jgi:hypothetical protein
MYARRREILLKKCGTNYALQNPDVSLNAYDVVKKDIDPLAIQGGKVRDTLVTFVQDYVMTQTETIGHSKTAAGASDGPSTSLSTRTGGKYPENFAKSFFYLMCGSSPGDTLHCKGYYGVVLQMVNYNLGIFNPILVSTSPFGMLYRDGSVYPWPEYQSVVPIFPQLLKEYFPHLARHRHKSAGIRAKMSDFEVAHSTFFRNTGNYAELVMDWEWIVTEGVHVKVEFDSAVDVAQVRPQGDVEVTLMYREDIKPMSMICRPYSMCDESTFLSFSLVNSAIMGTAKLPKRLSAEEVLAKARLRVKDGIDRAGHVARAATLLPLQLCVYMSSVAANIFGAFDARGIYQWEGLPSGRWHTAEDYSTGVDFGLSTMKNGTQIVNLKILKDFFEKLFAMDISSGVSSPYLLTCCDEILNLMF